MKIDIFLIDWERPRATSGINSTEIQLQPVSIWRTYFVANEWNEIQTKRKTSLLLQMLLTVLLLKVNILRISLVNQIQNLLIFLLTNLIIIQLILAKST